MIRFFIILLGLLSLDGRAAAPSVSCAPSRIAGTAPLGVFLDCTGTTDADTTKPFHDLEFRHNFGDRNAGKWSQGANTALSKNLATGPVAAHVYENAGTYTITSVVSDGANTVSVTNTITVTDPDLTYAGASTVCIANSAATAGAGGCPGGASTPAGTADFSAALATCIGARKRCLFKRGDTFMSSMPGTVASAGPTTLGAYGPDTSTLPIIKSGNTRAVLNISNPAVNDLRIMDLEIVGSGATDTGTGIHFGAAASNVTLLRVTIRDTGRGISVGGTAVLTGSVIQDSAVHSYHAAGGNAFFGRMANSALLGNNFGPVPAAGRGEHVLRLQRGQKVAISSNTLTTPNTTKVNLTIRGDRHVTVADDTFQVYVSDNKLVGGINAWTMQIGPSANTENAHIYDVIVERNWFLSGEATQAALVIQAVRVTARNNIMNLTGGRSGIGVAIGNSNMAGMPTPDMNAIVNNTIYSNDTAGNFYAIRLGVIGEVITNTTVTNNLAYAPKDTAHTLLQSGARVTGTIADNNSNTVASGGNGVSVNPSFEGPMTSPHGFRIGAASYALKSGTAVFPATASDFFRCRDKNGNARIGALVPRALAVCNDEAE